MTTSYYDYAPSFAAAIVMTVAFFIITTIHLYLYIRTRTWFWTPFVIGGIFEIVGYAGRAVNANQQEYQWTQGPFILQTIFILLAPVLFAASLYMMLARIALLSDPEKTLLIRRSWLTKIFVGCDILAFIVQIAGGVELASDDPDTVDRGRTIVLVGLWMQIVFFGFFITNALVFWYRARRQANRPLPSVIDQTTTTVAPRLWKKHIITLLLACVLILTRCVYRVVEYTEGKTGYLLSHEAFLYGFDSLLMFIVMSIFIAVHPSEIGAQLHKGRMAKFLKIVRVEERKDAVEV